MSTRIQRMLKQQYKETLARAGFVDQPQEEQEADSDSLSVAWHKQETRYNQRTNLLKK
jgi:hypothetical protein